MNNKIKQLAEQAGMNPIGDMSKFGMGESMNTYNCQGFMLEKFAELIVKECAKLITEDNPHTCYREIRDDRKIQAMRIKLEFGVE